MSENERVVACPCCRGALVLRIAEDFRRGIITASLMSVEQAAANPIGTPRTPAPASVETTP